MRNWTTHVYRTDVNPEEYVGFFYDTSEAQGWIKGKEGTYEVSTEKPRDRKAPVGAGTAEDAGGE